MSKLTLANGREVEIKPLPLDSSGDELADLLDKAGDAEGLKAQRETLAGQLFAPVQL